MLDAGNPFQYERLLTTLIDFPIIKSFEFFRLHQNNMAHV